MKIQGPIEVELKASVTNGEGVDGVVTIGLGLGRYPSVQDMQQAIANAERDSLPEGFRLMTKSEWFNSVVPKSYEEDDDGERHLVRYAVPGGNEWDAVSHPDPAFPERLIEMLNSGDLEVILFKAGIEEELRLELYRRRQALPPN